MKEGLNLLWGLVRPSNVIREGQRVFLSSVPSVCLSALKTDCLTNVTGGNVSGEKW